jgi:DNA-binding transcriptional ArsR family regulator
MPVDVDAVLAAVADRTRRAMLQRLAHGPATVGQLAALFPISRPAVSQHLGVLRRAGLVRPVRPTRTAPYELVPAPLFLVETWARELADTWTAAPIDDRPVDPAAERTNPCPSR